MGAGRRAHHSGDIFIATITVTMTNDGKIKKLDYTLIIHRPDPDYAGPYKHANEDTWVKFCSTTPFPIPNVGDDIGREVTFGDFGTRKQTPCRVTKVQHAIIEGRDSLASMVTVWTEEY